MLKRQSMLLVAASATSIGILVGCQDQPTAEERLASYSKLWEKQDYDKMYADYVSQTTQKEYGESQFIERTKKLNDTLEIKNISITPGKAPDSDDEKKQLLPVTVKFDTVAGPVSFKKDVPLVYETKKDTDNWYVDWDSSFLFEDFEQADQIKLNTLTAKRGELIDRNEKPLATTGQGFEVGVTAGQLNDTAKKKVASLLDRSTNSIDDALSASWVKDGQFVPLKTFDPSKEAIVKQLEAIKGVSVKETEVRTYPYGEATSHLIGYVGSATAEDVEQSNNKIQAGEQVGKRGLEQVFDDELRGQSGTSIEIVKSDQDEPVTVAETKVKDGKDITLTIDGALQQSTYETMNGEPGVATVIDPRTGETRTLVSSPGFDPSEFTLGISQDRLDTLTNDPDQPLLNRFTSAFAPGSTQKPLTASIGLNAGKLNPDKAYSIDGLKWKKDGFNVTRIHETPDPVDLHNALVYSDNIYFAQSTLEVGADTFTDGLEALGYGEKIPFAYPMRASQISNDGTISSDGQLMDTSYGQGQMLTNIVHLASMYEIFLTDGTIYQPTLRADEKTKQVWKQDLISKNDASMIRKDLYDVVHAGYDLPADIQEVAVAGKTGTAELKQAGETKGKENGFFVGYDNDDPTLLVAMMIESVEQEDRGSPYVSGLVAEVLKEAK